MGKFSNITILPFYRDLCSCLCRYSRRVIWMEVAATNNDPGVIAGYFVKAVERSGGTV